MQRWLVDPSRLQSLREEAQLTPEQIAELVGCHPQHYRKLERRHQPSDTLAWSIVNTLTQKLGRKVRVEDIAHPKSPEQAAA